MIRRAKAVWRGNGPAGNGHLVQSPMYLPRRRIPIRRVSRPRMPSALPWRWFRVSRSALTLRARVPNLDDGLQVGSVEVD